MPLDVVYEREGAGVLVTGTGIVRGAEFIAMNRRIYAADFLPRLRYQIVDISRVERHEVSAAEIQLCARQDREAAAQNPQLLIAVVAGDQLGFGLARMWEAYADDPVLKTRVYKSIEDARAWVESQSSAPTSA
jgi:hypothetical protein